jgi:hypothetical protein
MMDGLQQTLPGRPSIIAENIDGGGSIVGTNYFFANAAPDGLTYLAVGASTLLNQGQGAVWDKVAMEAPKPPMPICCGNGR